MACPCCSSNIVCVCRQNFLSPFDTIGDTVFEGDAVGRTPLPASVTASCFSDDTSGFTPPPSLFNGSYALQRFWCEYLWSSTTTKNGKQYGVFFGLYPPSINGSTPQPAVWFTDSTSGIIVHAVGFLLANYAALPNGIGWNKAKTLICSGGELRYSTQSGGTTATVSANQLP